MGGLALLVSMCCTTYTNNLQRSYSSCRALRSDLLLASCGRSSLVIRSRGGPLRTSCTTSAFNSQRPGWQPALRSISGTTRSTIPSSTPTCRQHKSSTPTDVTTQVPVANQDLRTADRLFSVCHRPTAISAIDLDR